ncbi:hypothetical protein BJY04DRAFT_217443 [Aspergillus karnatakaensis]|uniref:fungal specific transcription factor domain-containing protein n=1 Tax=Aspergillus karnatakaensis TaxID=1810916 RepID=UPI003CCD5A09
MATAVDLSPALASPENRFYAPDTPAAAPRAIPITQDLTAASWSFGYDIAQEALALYRNLLHEVETILAGYGVSLPSVAQGVIDCACQYMFPTAPILYERGLRMDAASIFGQAGAELTERVGDRHQQPWVDLVQDTGERKAQIEAIRTFALITGLCSMVGFRPQLTLGNAYLRPVAQYFLRASRLALRLIEDDDIRNPNSSSLIIRIVQATAHQHATGDTTTATFFGGQARLLAHDLRLYDESVYAKYDPVEAQLLRNAFWLLYTADQAAAALHSRPFTLHETLFETPLTTRPVNESTVLLLDSSQPHHAPPFEERLLSTFHLGHRMRALAADLTLGIRRFSRRNLRVLAQNDANFSEYLDITHLEEIYARFTFLLEDAPTRIKSPNKMSPGDQAVGAYQREIFWIQRTQLFVTFHCLRFTILHQCIEHDLTYLVGCNNDPGALAVRKVEIARDFVNEIEKAPFSSLQALGEPIVEQLRHVGSILLQLTQSLTNKTLENRANLYLSRLINILSSLDSKASDALLTHPT